MREFIGQLKGLIAELCLSKKFLTMMVGVIVTLCARIGFKADTETITSIVAIVSSYILAQGWADNGKERQKIENESKTEIANKILDSINSNKTKEEPKDG